MEIIYSLISDIPELILDKFGNIGVFIYMFFMLSLIFVMFVAVYMLLFTG